MRSTTRAAALTAATIALGATASGASAANRTYGGTLKQADDTHAIVLTTDAKGKQLVSAVIAYSAKCDDGMYAAFHQVIPARTSAPPAGTVVDTLMLVSPVSATGRFTGDHLGSYNGQPLTSKLKAKVTKTAITGTLSSEFQTTLEDGSGTITCRTGTMRFTARRRPGYIYGGATTQGEPVVLTLDARRRKVSEFDIDWNAECKPAGYFDLGDALTDFPLSRAGRFGDTFTQQYTTDSGGKLVYKYALKGKVTRTSMSGTAAISVTEGETTCATGPMTWKARSG